MSRYRERLGFLGRRFRAAEGAAGIAARAPVAAAVMAACCLAAAGCSAASQSAQQAASAAPSGTISALGILKGTTGGADFASNAATAVPPSGLGPPADPFAGTPADRWADGTAGITLPAATAIGSYTKAQVEYAYQTTRDLLVAAELNKQTLLGGAPAAFADLLVAPEKTWFEQNLNKKGADKNGDALSSRGLVMSFAPGSTQLIGGVIKVHGTMSARAATADNGGDELVVHVDYIFVYPIEPPHEPDDWMRVVNEVVWTMTFADWQGSASSFAPWVNATSGNVGGVSGVDCGTTDGYSHPDYPTNSGPSAQPSVSASGTPENPYVAGQQRSVPGCQATTGT